MKKTIIIAAIAATLLTGCRVPPAGTMHKLSAENAKIEVFKYYFDSGGGWVYVSRFADQPQVETSTWIEQHGKVSETQVNITLTDTIRIH